MQQHSEDLISFSLGLAIPSLVYRKPVHVTRSVLTRAGADNCVAEMCVPKNAGLNERFSFDGTTSIGYHSLAPAETIVLCRKVIGCSFWKQRREEALSTCLGLLGSGGFMVIPLLQMSPFTSVKSGSPEHF
eukprot:GFUD01036801.1.p1 GENE.GFUD01036801.1~~GFUD01036801.1.p1  ORF type:complete len:131 (+),score=17.77 GFUD01036801.1:143-535(+)